MIKGISIKQKISRSLAQIFNEAVNKKIAPVVLCVLEFIGTEFILDYHEISSLIEYIVLDFIFICLTFISFS